MIDETAQSRPLRGCDKAPIQSDCGFAMRQLQRAAERLMEIAGPGAFAAGCLQQLWRDLSLGTRHAAKRSLLGSELHGRALPGQDSDLALLAALRPAA